MATMVLVSHSNIISDYVFYGIHTVKVLVLKRFIPSLTGKNVSIKYVLVKFEHTYFML